MVDVAADVGPDIDPDIGPDIALNGGSMFWSMSKPPCLAKIKSRKYNVPSYTDMMHTR